MLSERPSPQALPVVPARENTRRAKHNERCDALVAAEADRAAAGTSAARTAHNAPDLKGLRPEEAAGLRDLRTLEAEAERRCRLSGDRAAVPGLRRLMRGLM